MYVRVVRFTDVTRERIESLKSRVETEGAPPPDAPDTDVQVLFDEEQGTAVVLQVFKSAEDMQKGDEVFGAMDPGDTPGTRASVDLTTLKFDSRDLG